MSPIATIKESFRLTAGYKMRIFITGLTVAIHFVGIAILIAFIGIVLMTIIPWLAILLFVAAGIYAVYGSLALTTLYARMYRDLQQIKSENTADETEEDNTEVIEVEEVLEGDQTEE